MGTGTDDAVHTQEEDEDNRKIVDSESQVSFNSSTHENEAPANTENGYEIQAVLEEPSGKEPETAANDFKINYRAAVRGAMNNV